MENNAIFYIGRTLVSLDKRLTGHLSDKSAPKSKKTSIIKSILDAGQDVVIEPLETIQGDSIEQIDKKLAEREKYWISELSKENNLANKAHNAANRSPNTAVTLYIDQPIVAKFGGREGVRMAIYEFLDGKIQDTGERSFIPFDVSDPALKWPLPKPRKSPPIKKPDEPIDFVKKSNYEAYDAPPQPKTIQDEPSKIQPVKPRNLDELKALCPAEITDKYERAAWVGKERQKYGI